MQRRAGELRQIRKEAMVTRIRVCRRVPGRFYNLSVKLCGMIQYLKIQNLALIENAEIEFSHGFTAITGETGAGKSILLGALMLLSGARSDKSQIKKNAESCELEAVLFFENSALVDKYLESFGLPLCEEGTLLLKRMIYRNKPARIYINNALATQVALSEIGDCWVDFHGPGEHQRLFKERYQLEILDLYSKNQNLISEYQQKFSEWRKVLNEITELSQAEKLSEDDVYFLKSQIDAIDRVSPTHESIEELELNFKRISNVSEIANNIREIENLLGNENGVLEKLSDAAKYARQLSEIDTSSKALLSRIDATIIDLGDVVQEYMSLANTAELDEEAVELIQQRMNQWLEIKRRYGSDVQNVLNKREALQYKLETQADVDGAIESLKKKSVLLENDLKKMADQLYQVRVKSGKSLCRKVTNMLASLGFQKAELTVSFTGDGKLHEYGEKQCQLQFRPNAGEDSLPLSKIASSGELARVMLAVKTALAELDQIPVLVFDEVDANIGGEAGVRVGEELASLGVRHQVICVTHLPQVAAHAKNHFVINKVQSKNKTDVIISSVHQNEEERLIEISRMLGSRDSSSAIKHAAELLKRS
jgi:DNA repair protein RecN (Recombination protein N)